MKTRLRLQWRDDLRVLPAMPLHIYLRQIHETLVVLESTSAGYLFTCSRGPMLDQPLRQELIGIDVWTMRNAFFRVRNPTEALDFLRNNPLLIDRGMPLNLTWNDFQRWQRFLKLISLQGFPFASHPEVHEERRAYFFPDIPLDQDFSDLFFSATLEKETAQWLRGHASHVSILKNSERHMEVHPDDAKTSCTVFVSGCIEAILASIYFGEVVGVKIKKCECEPCDVIFECSTNHERRFCCKEHAHTQGTRERRAEAKVKAVNKGRRKAHGK